jgi:TonB-linked SusC/RagA family outer membrane protein
MLPGGLRLFSAPFSIFHIKTSYFMNKSTRVLSSMIWGLIGLQLPAHSQLIASSGQAASSAPVISSPVMASTADQKQKGILLKDLLKEFETRYKISIAYQSGTLEGILVDSRVVNLSRNEPAPESSLNKILRNLPIRYRKSRQGFFILYREDPKHSSPAQPGGGQKSGVNIHRAATAITISGQVTDKESGEGLPGVSVVLKGTNTGTTTDLEGQYKLPLPDNSGTLVFSYIGYATQELPIGNQTTINMALPADVKALSEVVVTALGVKREERSLGYAVQEIQTKGIDQAKETNIVNAMTGKIAGVQITNASGNIGGSSRVTIRGVNSISGNNQPLFVVDGTPIDNSNYNSEDQQRGGTGRDYGNAAQDINPDDIASISVLKGPSAAALYGSRAGNGVILITTKSGEAGKGIGVTLNSSATWSTVATLPEFQNEYGGGFKLTFDEYNGQPIANTNANNSWGPRLEGQLVRQWYSMYPGEPYYNQLTPWVGHPDNLKDFFETGLNLSNNVSVAGGTEKSRFRLSYTNLDQKGMMPNSKLDRNTVSLNADTKLTDKFTAAIQANYIRTNGFGRPATGDWNPGSAVNVLTYWYTWTQRQIDVATLRNYQSERYRHMTWNVRGPETYNLQSYNNNPYFTLYEEWNNDTRDRVFGNVSLSYAINKDLKITGWARTDYYTDRREDRSSLGGYVPNQYSEDVIQFQENNFELLAQYQKELGPDLSLNVNLGTNRRESSLHRNYGFTQGGLSVPNFFNLNASVDRPILVDTNHERAQTGIYGSFNLGYRNILYLDGSLRNDWSSTLPADNDSYLYPALSTSLVFTDLLPPSNILSFGKLRAGWAQVGNDTDPYRTSLIYSSQPSYGSTPAYTVPNVLNNPLLKPERTSSYETGLDLRFFKRRLALDVTYYNNITTDQIIPLSISPTTGYRSAIVNAGKITNKGVELMLTGTPVELENSLSWDISFNWAKNKNEVVELAEGQDSYELGTRDGVSVTAKVGQPYGTLIGTGILRNEKGEKLVDANGYYVRNPGQVQGSVLADYTGGITNTLTYKGFNLSGLIDFQKGGDIFVETIRTGIANGQFIESVGMNDKGNPKRNPVSAGGGMRTEGVLADGSPNTIYVEAQNYYKQFNNLAEGSVRDASYIKFRELRMGYAFPKKLYQNLPVSTLSLSLVARNLGLLYKNMPHFDPSEMATGSGNVQGLEGAAIPPPRTIGFNLRIGL